MFMVLRVLQKHLELPTQCMNFAVAEIRELNERTQIRLCSNDHYISKESFGLKFRVKYLVKPIRQLPHNIKSF